MEHSEGILNSHPNFQGVHNPRRRECLSTLFWSTEGRLQQGGTVIDKGCGYVFGSYSAFGGMRVVPTLGWVSVFHLLIGSHGFLFLALILETYKVRWPLQ